MEFKSKVGHLIRFKQVTQKFLLCVTKTQDHLIKFSFEASRTIPEIFFFAILLQVKK